MMQTLLLAKNRSAAFLLLVACFLVVHAAGDERPPNILFLFTDDQRPDTIRALGNRRILTPNLDRLVEEGVSFTNAYIMGSTSMAVCTPSRASLFSGRSLWNLASQGEWDFAIPPQYKTMTQVFLENGYTCFATGKQDPGFGKNDHFQRSFDSSDNLYYRGGHRGQDKTPLFTLSVEGDEVKRISKAVDGRFNANLFADACVDFLHSRRNESSPFFAYVSFMTPHDPLNCPEEFLEIYEADELELPVNFVSEHPFDAGIHHIRDEKLMKRPIDRKALLERLGRYYSLITHTDAQIGRILKALEESGHYENTIIVFCSDNGLALGSHGLTGKQNLYEHSVKVPLVIRGPGFPKGELREQLCYLYDIYPTLCEQAGLDLPGTVEFRSLCPSIANPDASHRENLYFGFMSWQRAVRDEQYKLIEYCVEGRRHTQLFDLEKDAGETENLAAREELKSTLQRMQKLLKSEAIRLNDGSSSPPHVRKMSESFWAAYRDNK